MKETKSLLVVFISVLCISCAGAKLQNREAQQVIARQLDVSDNKIHVSSISELADTALVETVLRVTFVLQKDSSGKWKVIRMQHSADRWETPEEFLKSSSTSALSRSLESAFLAQLEDVQD